MMNDNRQVAFDLRVKLARGTLDNYMYSYILGLFIYFGVLH